MRSLIELLWGKWECVVAHVYNIPNKTPWLIVCHKHSVTGRVRGYVDMGKRPFQVLETKVVLEHIENYGKLS